MTAQDRANVRRNPVCASRIPMRVFFAPPLGHALPCYDEKANKHGIMSQNAILGHSLCYFFHLNQQHTRVNTTIVWVTRHDGVCSWHERGCVASRC
jgi:hypothetical protein